MNTKRKLFTQFLLGLTVTGISILGVVNPALAEDESPESLIAELQSTPGAHTLSPEKIELLDQSGKVDASGIITPYSCTGAKNLTAFLGNFLTYTDFSCTLIGTTTGTKNYSWNVSPFAIGGSSVCLNGKGWRYSISTGSYSYWRVGGCTTGNANFNVDWQNVAANPSIQYRAATAPVAGVAFSWK